MEKNNKENSIAFTGHRPKGLAWGYNEDSTECKKLKTKIRDAILKFIDIGFTTFYNGLAEGFDLYSAQILLDLKDEGYPIYLVGCIPCENQADFYSSKTKIQYEEIKNKCDELYYVTHGHYFNGCTFIRNKYMIDNARVLITYCSSTTGGTASTVKYAKSKGLEIVNLF